MKLLFDGLLILCGLGEMRISMEGRVINLESHIFGSQCGCDLYLMKPCCYFLWGIKGLHGCQLEVSESRSASPLLAKTMRWYLLPSSPIML